MRAVWTPGLTEDMFNRTVNIDYALLEKRCTLLGKKFEKAVSAHITAPGGTDLIVPLAGRKAFFDNGDFSKPGTGGNIPAGEVFLSPVVGNPNKDGSGCNGKIMQEFGRLLAKAHALCQKANIRYEDYLDRVLCLPRNSARDITRIGKTTDIDPSIGFDNMKMISSIKKSEERAVAQEKIKEGESPVTVRALMKQKASEPVDQRTKLEKEKNRLAKTIAQLQQRLDFVEETLASL